MGELGTNNRSYSSANPWKTLVDESKTKVYGQKTLSVYPHRLSRLQLGSPWVVSGCE